MKSTDEAISDLFRRREHYFSNKAVNRKRRVKAGVLLAAIVCILSIMYGGRLLEGVTESAASGISEDDIQYSVFTIASNDAEQHTSGDMIVINELESIPTAAEINYPVGDFCVMSRDEVLAYFRLRMDPDEMLPEVKLTETNAVHGFYFTKAGEVFPYDHFVFIDESKDITIDIVLQLKSIPQVVFSQTDYYALHQSQIAGEPVLIYHWEVDNVDFLYAEFMTEGGVGISMKAQNIKISSICTLVKYFLNQNRIVVREVQPHSIEKDFGIAPNSANNTTLFPFRVPDGFHISEETDRDCVIEDSDHTKVGGIILTDLKPSDLSEDGNALPLYLYAIDETSEYMSWVGEDPEHPICYMSQYVTDEETSAQKMYYRVFFERNDVVYDMWFDTSIIDKTTISSFFYIAESG